MAKTPKKRGSEAGSAAGPVRGARADKGRREIQELQRRVQKDPADEEGFVQLWDLLAAAEDWPGVASLLEGRAALLADPQDKVRALLRLGMVADEKLGDEQRAVRAYHQVLELDPRNRRALWALGVLYNDLEDWEKVIEIYLLRINLAESLEEKLSLRAQLAQIYEQRLQQEDQALMEYIRAARLAPQNVRVLLHMEKLATRTESFRELLAVYEDVVERTERIELRVALYLKLARLYTQHLEDETTAEGYYRRALELARNRPELLFSISNVYGEEAEWSELIATYTQLIRFAEEPGLKTAIRREVARIYRDGLQDPDAAFYELVRVARYDPSVPGLVDELFALGESCDKHLELAAVLEDVGARVESPAIRVQLFTRLARLHLESLQNAEQARLVLSRALEADPDFIPAQLLRFDLLEAGREFVALAAALETLIARTDLEPEVAKEQRKRLARLYEQKLDNRDRAVALYRENLGDAPQPGADESREEILEQLYRRQGAYEELLKLLGARLKAAQEPAAIAALALEMAELQERQLEQPDLAFFELLRAVKQAPGEERLLDELFRLGQEAGLGAALRSALQDLANTVEIGQAAGLHVRLGLLAEAEGRPDEAVDQYERALAMDATQPVAYQKLRARAENHEGWEQVVELDLRRASRIQDTEEKLELLFAAAELLEERLHAGERAADVFDRILSLAPDSLAARKAYERLRKAAGYSTARPAAKATARPPSRPPPAPAPAAPPPPLPPEPAVAEDEVAEVFSPPAPAAAKDEVARVFSPPAPAAEKDEVAEVFSPPDLVRPVPAAPVASPVDEDGPEEITDVGPLKLASAEDEAAMVVSAPPRPHEGLRPSSVAAARLQDIAEPAAQEAEDESELAREPTQVSPPPLAAVAAPPGSASTPAAALEAALAGAIAAPPEPPPPPAEPEELEESDFEAVEEPAPEAPPPPSTSSTSSTSSTQPGDDDGPMEEEKTSPGQALDPLEAQWRTARADPLDPAVWEKLASLLAEKASAREAFSALVEGLAAVADDEARARLYRRMSLLAQDTELRLRLAELLEARDRLDDAESSYRTVLRSDAGHARALDGLMRLYQKRGALERFDAFLSRAIKDAPDASRRRALLLRRAALRARELGRLDDALRDLEPLLRADEPVDLEALEIQEEILERTERHEELVKAYERRAPLVEDVGERVELLLAMAVLYEGTLRNPDAALGCYRRALEADPSRLPALDSLVDLLERRRDWLGALEVLRRSAGALKERAQSNQVHCRIGRILEEQLLRPEEAEEAYRQAVAGESPCIEALLALKGMARRRSDWVELLRLIHIQLRQAVEPRERAGLQIELARVWRERLENTDKAMECYQRALELDPDQLEAARFVAEAKLQGHHHAEALELLQRLARRGAEEGQPPEELAAVELKLAQTAEALERLEEAEQAFERCLALAPGGYAAMRAYGFFLARRGQWQRAVELYRQILADHRARLSDDEAADLHCLAAQGHAKLGQPAEAADHYRGALTIRPRHLPALRALLELSRGLGLHAETVALLSRLRELTPSPAGRMDLSVQIGDLLADTLNRPEEAALAYRQALEQEPGNLRLLESLRRVLVHAERFAEAVDVLESLAHLSDNERERARYLRIAGDLARERLDDDARALEFYVRALQAAPLDVRAHGQAVKILSRQRDWQRLAVLYEDQLKRLPPPIPGQDDRRVPMLAELTELYRYRIEDRRKAIACCESLLAIDKGQLKVREDLARLYEAEGLAERAILLHRSLIADSPFAIDSYHALRRIYETRGERDRTLCLCATLAFLDEADEDEREFLRSNRHALPLPPGRHLGEAEHAELLLHPSARGLLGEMFAFAADYARPLFLVDPKELKLRARDRLELAKPQTKLAEVLQLAVSSLGLPPPEVYARGPSVKGLMAFNTSPVSVLYSEEAAKLASVAELRFMAARAVAFTRPEHLISASLSPKQLRQLLDALVELAFPGGSVLPADQEVSELAKRLGRQVPEGKRERLRQLAGQFRERAEELSIRDWLEGIEHTCNRAGLLLCGDLEAAVQVLKAARVVSPSGSHRTLIRELIFYSISDEYFRLRKALNAAL